VELTEDVHREAHGSFDCAQDDCDLGGSLAVENLPPVYSSPGGGEEVTH